VAKDQRTGLENKPVLFRKERGIGIITLNRPEKLNALVPALIVEFSQILDVIREDDELSVIVLTGAGRTFSTGADIDMLSSLEPSDSFRRTTREMWQRPFDAMEDMEKLFIAALNGLALGMGMELALACDLRVAAEGVKIALPEINFGIIPDVGGTIRLTRLVGPSVAKELALSGDSISCEEAREIGLINKILPADNFMEEVFRYASRFAGKPRVALGMGKLTLNRNTSQDIKAGLEDALNIQSVLLKTPDYRERIDSFREKLKKKV
jgi:enoyl-CoA hydratase